MTTALVLVARAQKFARAHAGLVRPNKAQQPYSVHLQEVANIVELSGGSGQEIAAAWLHDTIEDTDATIELIRQQFGDDIAEIVEGLTDHPDIGHLPTLQRKVVQAQRLAGKSQSVKRVKIADGISNLRSVAVDPPVKWSKQKTLDYITGCALVAYQCRGISEYLDKEFYTVHRCALIVHL